MGEATVEPKQKRRWYQYSLASLSLLLLVAAIECAGCSKRIEMKPLPLAAKWVDAPAEVALDLGDGVMIDLVLIRPGSFGMGDAEGKDDERPVHRVDITKPFYMGKCEVTQAQWESVMDDNPSHFRHPENPVEGVGYDDAHRFFRKLNERFAGRDIRFRLPTEAEWEYACRAGTTTRWSFGDDPSIMGDYGWFRDNNEGQTHPVGQKKPNAWGLYDMHGNVYEWCEDWYGEDFYERSPESDPTGPDSGEQKIIRGGCWCHDPDPCRTAVRCGLEPSHGCIDEGLRVVVSSPTPIKDTPVAEDRAE